ncbi:palmitoyltransferase ZDHHC23-like isoform X2 [Homarus americanus]|uniref:Palmitoyltransferase n=2 Tax=Homarus americanus TaxID=6706 RepID=A0A8J5JRD6_HOMAM|nr:palmitoyltransferase ZDHHC23-like isoform X2 [Homarus americanus]KAG7162751.1 Palmitoyltransferase ZDHHC23-like [Homarus americanus]
MNEDGERSHVLLAFCNCDAIDEAFERLFTLQSLERGNVKKVIDTLSDRLRIPWCGGAKKVPLDLSGAVLCVIITVFLGCFSWTLTVVTYVVILPAMLYSVHRCIRKKVTHENPTTYGAKGIRGVKYPRSRFYFAWVTVSLASLLIIYYTQVIPHVKISLYENFIFMVFTCLSCTCLYLVRATSCAGFEPQNKGVDEECEEVIESGAWRFCGKCETQVPRQATHCRTCDTCYLLRDHHCIWLDTCINCVNDRWFVIGLICGLCALCYGVHLSLTTVCHPQHLDVYFTTLLVPHRCPDAFASLQSSLSVSGACYGILLATFVAVALVQQLVCVLSGVRLREYRRRRELPNQFSCCSFRNGFRNCFVFWWRR